MRWLVRFAVWSALASACSTFDSESDDTPPTTADAGDATPDVIGSADTGLDSADAASNDGCMPFGFSTTFDDPSSIAVWQQVVAPPSPDGAPGTVGITGTLPDGEAPFSAPAALLARGRVQVEDGGVVSGLRSFAEYNIVFVPSSIHLKYKLSVPSTSPYAEVGCDLLFSDGDAGAARIDTFMSAGQLYARRSNADGSEMPFTMLGAQPKDWIAIDIVASVDGDAGVAMPVVNGTGLPQVILPPGAKEVFVQCGIGYADFGGPATSGPDLVEVVIDDLELVACH